MKNVGFLCLTIIFLGLLTSCSKNNDTPVSIFSWQEHLMDNMDKQSSLMEKTKVKQLYQNIENVSEERIQSFFEQVVEKGYSAYALCGEPEWIFDSKTLLDKMDNYAKYKEQGLQGVVVDVEPYLLPQWDERKKEYMQGYVSFVKAVYQKAQLLQLEIILCIPYYYDTLKLQSELEQLIQYSDGIAVMNYYKEDEYEHIETELEIAKKYQKKLVVIYEMQKPGSYDLTDKHTYYKDGIKGVEDSFADIKKEADYEHLEYAFHGLWEGGFIDE